MTLRKSGRTAFLVPWPRHWVVGTTDRPHDGPIDRVAATAEDVDEILGTLNGALALGLTRDDVVGTFAGLRPLVARSGTGSTVGVSREHLVRVEAPGLVRVSGGKYTTYRVMAGHAVDAVLGEAARGRPGRTRHLPIHGAAERPALDALAGRLEADGLTQAQAASLVARHGTEAPAVVALGREHDLLRPLVEGEPYLEAEVAWATERELALTLDDILARRMRLAHVLPDRGAAIAGRVTAIVGHALGWGADQQAAEVAVYLAGSGREFGVPGG
jgi:glycerol-3-phosphate dehydrogenase